ncbi:hypothetical protein GCM10010176_006240 [Nonomuraea spiralis]|nr:serine hydrolase [Nonomuraea spiralis]GGS66369.1 hypothetical protein GCM10010176_006240 [Nonomuraea spiralis]
MSKALAAAAVLHRNPLSHLDDRVTFTRADVGSISPITQHRVATGMTVRELCDAAIRYSDGTAGNLLMRDTTTPRAIAADYRAPVLGDVLDPAKRALLEGRLVRTTTGTARIRAGLPKGWKPAHKTGTGDHGRANDIAVVWPPG